MRAEHMFPTMLTALDACAVYDLPPFGQSDGIRDAARLHDALARRKYAKTFKWFKFNRARMVTAK